MRRKSDKETRKEFRVFFTLGIIAILFGLFILLLPVMPTTPYEKYNEKEIVISKLGYHYILKGASYHYIITENGEKYIITGEYDISKLSETLAEGTVAVIKYDANHIFPFKKHIEEMTVDGNKIITYNNDIPINRTPHIIFGMLSFLIGLLLLFVYRWKITRNRKLQAKRDVRIAKKYENLEK